MKRRICALAAAGMLLATLFAGCGGESGSQSPAQEPAGQAESVTASQSGDPVSLTYWHTFTEGVRKEYMDQLVEEYMGDHPQVTVNTEVYTWAMFADKWTTGLAAGALPDVSNISNGNVFQIYSADALLPLNGLVESMGRDTFIDSAVDGLTVDGDIIALPYYMHAYVLWYRQDILDLVGKAVPTNWEEMLEVTRAIREETDYYGFPICMSKSDYIATDQLHCWSDAYGATILDQNNNANLTDPKMLEVIQFMADLYEAGSPEGSVNYGANELNELFYTGKTAFTMQSGFIASSVEANSPELIEHLGATQYFGKNGENETNLLNMIGLAAWSHTASPDTAMDFIRYHYEDERYADFLTLVPGGMLPATTSQEVSGRIFANEFVQKIADPVGVIMDAIADGTMSGMNHGLNLSAGAIQGSGIIEEMFQDIALNNKSVEEAAQAASVKLQDAIDMLLS